MKTIDISWYITYNHSYWSYLHQLSVLERGHHLVCASCWIRAWGPISSALRAPLRTLPNEKAIFFATNDVPHVEQLGSFMGRSWNQFHQVDMIFSTISMEDVSQKNGETWFKRFPQMLHGPGICLYIWITPGGLNKIWWKYGEQAERRSDSIFSVAGRIANFQRTHIFGIIRSCLSGECGQFSDEVFPFGTSPSKQKWQRKPRCSSLQWCYPLPVKKGEVEKGLGCKPFDRAQSMYE